MIYILVGVPGSGKTWVTDQLKDDYVVVEQDDYIGLDYAKSLLHVWRDTPDGKDIIANTPFGLSKLMEDLEDYKVEAVFIIENQVVLSKRYSDRTSKTIPKGHITRQDTYRQRARDLNAYSGTSEQVLQYLKGRLK